MDKSIHVIIETREDNENRRRREFNEFLSILSSLLKIIPWVLLIPGLMLLVKTDYQSKVNGLVLIIIAILFIPLTIKKLNKFGWWVWAIFLVILSGYVWIKMAETLSGIIFLVAAIFSLPITFNFIGKVLRIEKSIRIIIVALLIFIGAMLV